MASRRKRSHDVNPVRGFAAAISRSRTLLPTFDMAAASSACVFARGTIHGAGVLRWRLVGEAEGRIEEQLAAFVKDVLSEMADGGVSLVGRAGGQKRGGDIAPQGDHAP